jgi:hypothetical protein
MFSTVDQAVRAVKKVLAITNAFLVATASRESKVRAELQIADSQFLEELIECV